MRLLGRPLFLASLVAAVGCYAAEPAAVGVAPELGTRMSFQLNDQGRAALGVVMGDGLERIDGRLLSRESAGYLVAVSEVRRSGGALQVWAGEPIRLEDRHVRGVSIQRYSRRRTAIAVAGGVGALALILTRGIDGFALGSDPSTQPRDSLSASLRLVLP